jgi:hypothetical protein
MRETGLSLLQYKVWTFALLHKDLKQKHRR